MSKSTHFNPETNEITHTYHRNKWVAVVMSIFVLIGTPLYTREYRLFWYMLGGLFVTAMILPDEGLKMFWFLFGIGMAIRYGRKSHEEFDDLINRRSS